MFWSKIWFFLVTVAAAAAMTIALSMPRPAERQTVRTEEVRLKRACGITNILLEQNARDRVDLSSAFARADAPAGRPRLKLDSILFNASKASKISGDLHATAKTAVNDLLENVKGNKPDFVIAVDRKGRVVVRAGIDEERYGDSVRGYFAVEDALNGYLRDDLWYVNNSLYRVAVSPVIERRVGQYAGAIVLGHEFNKELAEKVADNVGAHVAFYAKGSAIAASHSAQIHGDVTDTYEQIAGARPAGDEGTALDDCKQVASFTASAGEEQFSVSVARLPGEASRLGAFYAVFTEKPEGVGFVGTLGKVTSNDLSFGNFPWIKVGVLLLIAMGIGLALMIIEHDRPLRRLNKDAVALAQGETNRLEEMAHKGKMGSIARSVNIVLDKLERDAKSAKRDLDNILGPAPASKPAASATPVPAAGPSGPSPAPFKPPPPSEFKFSDGSARPRAAGPDPVRPPTEDDAPNPGMDLDLPPPPPAVAATASPSRPATPIPSARQEAVPPKPISLPPEKPKEPQTPPPLPPAEKTPPPMPVSRAKSIDDDILGVTNETQENTIPRNKSDFDDPTVVADPEQSLLDRSASDDGGEDTEFKRVFDEFTALKQQCGEKTDSLTFERFAGKLRKNRDALIAKHGCRSVKFQVYIKDGKAALKATPVKS